MQTGDTSSYPKLLGPGVVPGIQLSKHNYFHVPRQ